MKTIIFKSIAAVAFAFSIASCNNNNPNSKGMNGSGDTTTNAAVSTDVKMGTDSVTMQSQTTNNGGTATTQNDFVMAAAGGGMMEVELGKLAQTNSSNADVKAYGKMLETDHGKANAELMSIAAANNIAVPSSMPQEHVGHVDMLKAKTSADFDKAFIDMMLMDHEKDIAAFKDAAKNNSNEQVKAFAAKTLPTLEQHLAKAKSIKSKMK